MLKKFLYLQIGSAMRIFAITGIAFVLWLNTHFPVIGVNSFARRVVLRNGASGPVVDYPHFLAVMAAVDTPSSVAYMSAAFQGERDRGRSLLLYIGDLDTHDIELHGASPGSSVFLVVDCGRVSNATIHRARIILQKKPIDETAFRKLPLTSAQRAVLKLQYCRTPITIIGIPPQECDINVNIVIIKFETFLLLP